MRTFIPRLPSGSGATTWALVATGVAMLAVGLFFPGRQATTATALIVIGAGMFAVGIMFPHVRELEIGLSGFKTKIVEAEDRERPIIGLKAQELTRFAYLVSGDHKHARELVEEALARGGRKYRDRDVTELDLPTLRTLIASLDTASERRWLSGKTGAREVAAKSPADSSEVVKALQELSFRQRVAFLLHADWALRSEQIAEAVENPIDGVRRDIETAREILRPHIAAQMADAQ